MPAEITAYQCGACGRLFLTSLGALGCDHYDGAPTQIAALKCSVCNLIFAQGPGVAAVCCPGG